MTTIDYILIAPIIFGFCYGLYRGFFKELVAFVCVIVGIYAARYFGAVVADLLSGFFSVPLHTAKAISCFVIFLAVVICLNILAKIMTKLFSVTGLGWLNRLVGGVFGAIKFILIVSILLNIITFFNNKIPVNQENKLAQSQFYQPMENIIPTIIPFIDFDFFMDK
jgi:membrane protein required for colicin V production